MSVHYGRNDRHIARYKKGNGIATILITLEWVVIAVSGLLGKMLGMENWQFVNTPNLPALIIVSFATWIGSAFIGKWLFGVVANKYFGGDEEKTKKVDKIVMAVTMVLWMVLFCFAINAFNKATYGENWAEENRNKNKEQSSQTSCFHYQLPTD
ncbi:hypothetical protein SAMN02910447_00110 [Ruminococcus sp. YE71]|uniref:hypothetical protein n=1 Tax=unclassified Ruminococcus TaxID=2608920 RepID=UPI000891420F|nr:MULTISPECIES: hypothetical protein [unclassified Ruminococcus]SDA09991.1 hypothetical protein SAMN02910446_00239 [Ruminococcus sp. YE78]SFW11188.1 hypothetical protein SAMN02910447_00110 [Ruminococcus sp. YE71]